MNIISWNVNGLRAVYKRNFVPWLAASKADVVCLQEIKLQEAQLTAEMLWPQGYYSYFNWATKKGYAGVAVYSKLEPVSVERHLGFQRFDEEGRLLRLHFPAFTILNVYLPHGGRQKENLSYKLAAYDHFVRMVASQNKQPLILIGDFNIAHKEIDLARPRYNQQSIMFTPEERQKIDQLVAHGFTDTFRAFHSDGGHYTWWPYYATARERNLGWRIDYTFTAPSITPHLKAAFVLPDIMGSDHCPVGIEI